eukprot:10256589-Alexandrium_andersonii.AAC.1
MSIAQHVTVVFAPQSLLVAQSGPRRACSSHWLRGMGASRLERPSWATQIAKRIAILGMTD